jgi:hypothetical protein
MNNSPVKLIGPERVKIILECYGADPAHWPQDERRAALSLLDQSVELQTLQQDAIHLDKLLLQTPGDLPLSDDASATLVSRIVEQLPIQQPLSPHSRRNAQQLRRQHWSIAAAAAVLLLAIPVFTQMQGTKPDQAPEQVALADYEQWLWEDITGDAVSKDNETLDFMALVELEQYNPQ